MKKRHKCDLRKCLIKYRDYVDLAGYCKECGKIVACLDNDERIAVETKDGRLCRRLKTSAELISEYATKYPIFEIMGELND